MLLRVYDLDGQLVPNGEDLDDLLALRERELVATRGQLAALQAELRRLRGE